MEEIYATREHIRSQILCESLVHDVKGLATFIFTYLLEEPRGIALKAYMDSLEDFIKIQRLIKIPPKIALFLPRKPEYWAYIQNSISLIRKIGVISS